MSVPAPAPVPVPMTVAVAVTVRSRSGDDTDQDRFLLHLLRAVAQRRHQQPGADARHQQPARHPEPAQHALPASALDPLMTSPSSSTPAVWVTVTVAPTTSASRVDPRFPAR